MQNNEENLKSEGMKSVKITEIKDDLEQYEELYTRMLSLEESLPSAPSGIEEAMEGEKKKKKLMEEYFNIHYL